MNCEQAIIQLDYERKLLMQDHNQFRDKFMSTIKTGFALTPEYKEFQKRDDIIKTAIARIMKLQKDKYQKEIDEAVELKLKELWGID